MIAVTNARSVLIRDFEASSLLRYLLRAIADTYAVEFLRLLLSRDNHADRPSDRPREAKMLKPQEKEGKINNEPLHAITSLSSDCSS
jgi:hypothetical protein